MRSLTLMLVAALMWGSLPAQSLDKVLEDYITVKNSLVNGNQAGAASHALQLVTSLEKLKGVTKQKSLNNEILVSAKAMAKAGTIEQQRTALASQSELLWKLIKGQRSLEGQFYYDYCPMKKAHWISESASISNPFYGKQMLTCGNVEESNK